MFKTTYEMGKAIAAAASDKKARNIVLLDMKGLTTATDYFIICSANSALQVRAIADNIENELAIQGMAFLHKEGYRSGSWVLLDYGDCVAHIFTDEDRNFYNLEQLWNEAPVEHYIEETV